jgi:hypothetical protein
MGLEIEFESKNGSGASRILETIQYLHMDHRDI